MNYFHICSATLFALWITKAMVLNARISLILPGREPDINDVDPAELHGVINTGQYALVYTPLQLLG